MNTSVKDININANILSKFKNLIFPKLCNMKNVILQKFRKFEFIVTFHLIKK